MLAEEDFCNRNDGFCVALFKAVEVNLACACLAVLCGHNKGGLLGGHQPSRRPLIAIECSSTGQ